MREWRIQTVIAGFLFSLCCLYFNDVLTGRLLLTERDLSIFFIPPRIEWVGMVRDGQMPLWTPYWYCGVPLLADILTGVLYPINILLVILPFDIAYNFIIVFHFFLAGYFTYLLIRRLKGTVSAALAGALVFMFSGYLLSVHNLLTHLLSVAWLPAVLLWYQGYLESRQSRPLVWMVLCLAMMFLGGGIEILYGTLIIIAVLWVFPNPFGVKGEEEVPLRKKILALGLVSVLLTLVVAVQLLPFLELASKSIRARGLPYKMAIIWSLDFKDFIQFFIPDPYGYRFSESAYWENQSWLKTIYLGIIPFVLSVFFVLEARRRVISFLVVALVSLLLSLGGNTPVYRLLYDYFPVFDSIRYPVKFLFIFVFFISVAAGFGFDALNRQIQERNRLAGRLIRSLLVLSVAFAACWAVLNVYEKPIAEWLHIKGICAPHYNFVQINLHNAKRFLLFCLMLGPILVFGWRYPGKRRIFSSVLLLWLGLDLFCGNQGYYDTYDSKSFHRPSSSVSLLKKDKSHFRVVTAKRVEKAVIKKSKLFPDPLVRYKQLILPGFNAEHHICCIDGTEVVKLQEYAQVLALMYSAPRADATNLLSMMNVKYIIHLKEMKSNELALEHFIEDKGNPKTSLRIYRNLNVLPRAFLVDSCRVFRSDKEYVKTLWSKGFNPAEVVLLSEEPPKGWTKAVGQGGTAACKESKDVTITKYEPNRVELTAHTDKPRFLFMSDSYYPGWKVYVDGREEKLYKANYAFRAVPLLPGAHKVEFVFVPISFYLGAGLTLVGIVACIIVYRKNPRI